ncbi:MULTISPECIES: tyrosine-type recombinase/integrase [Bacillus]|uniref:tyrosine-type recombinase/integrase n=1 Tax=Bacillus TaxID=1386 RepID=UPI0028A65E1A|nr:MULTISPECIES: tyrosine-type recombinase/integrase [Bacillus]
MIVHISLLDVLHSLRRTLASMLLEKDTPLPAISEILGHVNTESTAVWRAWEHRKQRIYGQS